MNRKSTISGLVLTITSVSQIILAFILYNPAANECLINTGWIILMLSAVFGWVPIFTFRKRGGVIGRGYINTTRLVDSGIYAIVRHPQYLAGILISVALPFITQHWLVILPGLASILINYLDTYLEEEQNVEKFGDAYIQYMKRVPRLNFILGSIRCIFPKG
jgi:protein-S-isoprenylcysteine O-methyltransferase Ste14